MKFSRFIDIVVFIPNIPFYLIFCFYFLFKVLKHTGIHEIMLMGNSDLPKDLVDYLDRAYPKHLEYFIAFIFYSSIILHLIF